ncbi:hypothetical protein N657DRAFT_165263 [Parathielavia appendiculata]|uniref:Uncharacterized protein n=1 Tax=Parathielavia appendiculata TaxID=2587402 RepID=A0AAN6TT60_9PEZI|nr:hypothetical protein N657DRAFT_165263 [Parathielavia appendiculata]
MIPRPLPAEDTSHESSLAKGTDTCTQVTPPRHRACSGPISARAITSTNASANLEPEPQWASAANNARASFSDGPMRELPGRRFRRRCGLRRDTGPVTKTFKREVTTPLYSWHKPNPPRKACNRALRSQTSFSRFSPPSPNPPFLILPPVRGTSARMS